MLLQTHHKLLNIALYLLTNKIIKPESKSKPKSKSLQLNIYNNNILTYNISNRADISYDYDSIILDVNMMISLFEGLNFPDMSCDIFHISEGIIKPELKICKLTKFNLDDKNADSQLYESHNGFFSINHSMTYSETITNRDVLNNIIMRIIALSNYFIDTKNYKYLGYIIHIIQDSWANGHINRYNKLKYNIDIQTINNITNLINDFEYKIEYDINSIKLIYTEFPKIIRYLLSIKENVIKLFEIIKNEDFTLTKILNKIFEMIIKIEHYTVDQINILLNDLIIVKGKKQTNFEKYINKKYIIITEKNNKIIGKNINITEKNIPDFFLEDIKYDSFPTKIRRVYKMTMNYLFTYQELNKIDKIKENPTINLHKQFVPPIINFRYYLNQNHDRHMMGDCEIFYDKLYSVNIYKYVVIDSANIINILLNTKNTKLQKIINLYNYLINYTYHCEEKFIDNQIIDLETNFKSDFKIENVFTCKKDIAAFIIFNYNPVNTLDYINKIINKKSVLYNKIFDKKDKIIDLDQNIFILSQDKYELIKKDTNEYYVSLYFYNEDEDEDNNTIICTAEYIYMLYNKSKNIIRISKKLDLDFIIYLEIPSEVADLEYNNILSMIEIDKITKNKIIKI